MDLARKLSRSPERKAGTPAGPIKTGKFVRLDERGRAAADNFAAQYDLGTGLPFIPAQAFSVEDLFTIPKPIVSAAPKTTEPAPPPGPTGPRTPEGKAKSSLNNLRHGLAGAFRVLDHESQSEFDDLAAALCDEHQPATATEAILVQRLAEHFWLSRRAQNLQDAAIIGNSPANLGLFLRYQTTNDRAFHKCLAELARLRKERRQFESQNTQTHAEFESQNAQPAEKKHASAPVARPGTLLRDDERPLSPSHRTNTEKTSSSLLTSQPADR
jgi:hypothetical protein